MSNQYSNLPGVNVSVKDGQMLLTTDRTSNSMLIVAEAKTGKVTPKGPVYISNESELRDSFGGFFYQGELNPIAAQWAIARQNGVRNIFLMALAKGDSKARFVDLHNKLFNLMEELSFSHVVLDGLYADEEITGLTASDFGVTVLDELDTIPTLYQYNYTVGAVVEEGSVIDLAVDGQTLSIVIDTVTELENALSQAFVDNGIGGTVRLSSNKILSDKNIKFEGEAAEAIGLTTRELVAEGSPAALLANYAETTSNEIGSTVAYISVAPASSIDLSGIKAHTAALLERNNAVSPYLQVIAGPQVGVTVPGSLRTQWVSGVAQYATLVSQLAPQNAPTNQVLPGAVTLRYNLSPRQLNDLTGAKYVTFRTKNGQIRVVDGVTTAPDLSVGQDIVKSDFTRLSTLRIVNYMVNVLRDACDPFIGMPNAFANYNAMNTAIKAQIDRAIEEGIIQDARYSISLGQSLDASDIQLTILPQFELRTINVTIGLTTPDNF